MTTPPLSPRKVFDSEPLVQLRRLAVDRFRPRGRAYDRDAALPLENIRDLHELGWLKATVGPDLGGLGSNLDLDDKATYLQAIRSVAQGCPSTAHCMQVHFHTMWIMERLGTPYQIERFLEPALAEGKLGAFVGSEARRRSQYLMNTSARRVDGGWIVNGEKNYATNASHMQFAIINTAIEGVQDYMHNHLMVLITPRDEGVSFDEDWYRPNGMRAADSPVITLRDVFVPDAHVVGTPGIFPRERWQGKYHLGFTANYIGATEGMYEWLLQYMRLKERTRDPLLHLRVGEIRIALDGARALFHEAIETWAEGDVTAAELRSIAAKSTAAHVAFDASHKIIHCAGSTALFDEFPLSRYVADLETHVPHAVHDKSSQILGAAALGESFDSSVQR